MAFRRTFCIVILAFLISFGSSLAGETGKLTGTITDATTGQKLAGASVLIEGTTLGSATDLDGDYTILRVPPGRHTISISFVGYQTLVVDNVLVESDKTTRLSFALEQAAVEAEEVVITWTKPPVDLTETNERTTVQGEVVRQLPMRQLDQIVALQAGAVTDASGDLHIRGGRSGEIAYYVDGIRVEDPLSGDRAQQISREALQELSVLSGTFNAEYGDAMSGVVTIVTREGGEEYEGSLEYETGFINSSPYREADWASAGSDSRRDPVTGESEYKETNVLDELDPWIPIKGRLSASFGGPVPFTPNMTFFVLGVSEPEDLWEPFGYKWVRKAMGKTAWTTDFGKLTFSGTVRKAEKKSYSHSWKYVPEHYHTKFDNSERFGLSFTRSPSEKLYYTINLGYFNKENDVKVFEDWDDYLANVTKRKQPLKDFTFAGYFYEDDDWSDTYRESSTLTYSASSKVTWQMNHVHQWDAGMEVRQHNAQMEDWRDLQIATDGSKIGVVDRYDEDVIDGALYVQDKIELDYLVVNAGLRFDYVDPETEGWSDIENPLSPMEDAPASYQLSPRLGLAHPISDRLTLHFAYGHFFQYPDYVNLFMNSSDLDPDTLAIRSFDVVGNRMLKPQKTVAYEVGMKAVLTPVWGLSMTAFYKDITDLVGTRQVRVGTAYNYAAMVNIDYANVKGFEFGIVRNLSNYWSLQANYTYSVAKGNSSEPMTGYYDAYYNETEVRQEYYMDFDRRHVFNTMLTISTGENNYPEFFHTTALRGIQVGITVNVASGLPYTPYSGAGEQLALRNSERMDYTATVDFRLSKTVVFKPVGVTLFTSITNLFDRVNPISVNSRTGEPWETTVPGNDISYDQIHNPSYVGDPRIVRVGMQVDF